MYTPSHPRTTPRTEGRAACPQAAAGAAGTPQHASSVGDTSRSDVPPRRVRRQEHGWRWLVPVVLLLLLPTLEAADRVYVKGKITYIRGYTDAEIAEFNDLLQSIFPGYSGTFEPDGDGEIMDADTCTVELYARQPFPVGMIKLGETETDSTGKYEMAAPLPITIFGNPVLYARIEARNRHIRVKNDLLSWHPYEQYGDWVTEVAGTRNNRDNPTPINKEIHGKDAGAFHILSTATKARRFIAENSTYAPPSVSILWPSDIGEKWYSFATETIRLNGANTFKEDVVAHEYGHAWLDYMGAFEPTLGVPGTVGSYRNGRCDDWPTWGHCRWGEESGVVAFQEGFPDFFAHLVLRGWTSRYPTNPPLNTIDLEKIKAREEYNPFTREMEERFHNPWATEGFFAALLLDIEDEPSKNERDGDALLDGEDCLSLGTSHLMAIIRSDRVSTPLDFAARFLSSYPRFWKQFVLTALNNRYDVLAKFDELSRSTLPGIPDIPDPPVEVVTAGPFTEDFERPAAEVWLDWDRFHTGWSVRDGRLEIDSGTGHHLAVYPEPPAAVSRDGTTLDVVGRSFDGDLMHFHGNSEIGWTGENVTESLGLDAASKERVRLKKPLALISTEPGSLDAFGVRWTGSSGLLELVHYAWRSTSGWSAQNVTDLPHIGATQPIGTLNAGLNTPIVTQVEGEIRVYGNYRRYRRDPAGNWTCESYATTGIGSLSQPPAIVELNDGTSHAFSAGQGSPVLHHQWSPSAGWTVENLTEALGGGESFVFGHSLKAVSPDGESIVVAFANALRVLSAYPYVDGQEIVVCEWDPEEERWSSDNLTESLGLPWAYHIGSYGSPLSLTSRGPCSIDILAAIEVERNSYAPKLLTRGPDGWTVQGASFVGEAVAAGPDRLVVFRQDNAGYAVGSGLGTEEPEWEVHHHWKGHQGLAGVVRDDGGVDRFRVDTGGDKVWHIWHHTLGPDGSWLEEDLQGGKTGGWPCVFVGRPAYQFEGINAVEFSPDFSDLTSTRRDRVGGMVLFGWAGTPLETGNSGYEIRYSDRLSFTRPLEFRTEDILDLPAIAEKLQAPARPFDTWLLSQLSPATLTALTAYAGAGSDSGPLLELLVEDLNRILEGPSIYEKDRFAGITLLETTKALVVRPLSGEALVRLNRLLLQDAYGSELAKWLPVQKPGIAVQRVRYGTPKGSAVQGTLEAPGTRWQVFALDDRLIVAVDGRKVVQYPVEPETKPEDAPLRSGTIGFWIPNQGQHLAIDDVEIKTYAAEALEAPLIVGQPQGVIVNEGETATFDVTVESEFPVEYQWYRKGSPDAPLPEDGRILGVTGPTLVISDVQQDDGLTEYKVIVSNPIGATASDYAQLTLLDLPPVIVCPEDIMTAQEPGQCGATVAFSVTATDDRGVVGVTAEPASGSFFQVGATTVTATALDTGGNVSQCTFSVTVTDTEPPVVFTRDLTVQLDRNGNAVLFAADIDNGSADPCGIAVLSLEPSTFDCGDVGMNEVTLTATDGRGNSAAATATVWVQDNIPPTVVVKPLAIPLSMAGTVTIGGADIDGGSSDACGIASLEAVPAGFTSADLGDNVVTLVVRDVYGILSTGETTVTILKRETALEYLGDSSGQYSDEIRLSARLTDRATSTPLAGKPVAFTIGNQTVTALTGEDGLAAETLILNQAPTDIGGPDTVLCEFAGDQAPPVVYDRSESAHPFDLLAEDARAEHLGPLHVSTATADASVADIPLYAVIQDISAALDDPADAHPGDIRNAQVTFVDRLKDNTPINPTPLPVKLLDPDDLTVGSVSYRWEDVDMGDQDARSFEVGIVIGHYYGRNQPSDNALITVARPAANFASGGGFIVLEDSAGWLAGDGGSKANFGLSVKFDKKGNRLHGSFSLLVRRTEPDGIVHTYRLEAKHFGTLGVDPDSKVAFLAGQAKAEDVTDPENPVPMGGNFDFLATLQDHGNPGSADLFGVTLLDRHGALVFSSQWTGMRTEPTHLGGGNLKVTVASEAKSSKQGRVIRGPLEIERLDGGLLRLRITQKTPGAGRIQTSSDLEHWQDDRIPGIWGAGSVLYVDSAEEPPPRFYRFRLHEGSSPGAER